MKRLTLISFFLSVSLLAGCASAAQSAQPEYYSPGVGGGAPESRSLPAEAPVAMEAYDAAPSADLVANQAGQQQRLVIKNADLTIVIKDPQAKLNAISAMATRLGGYVVTSSLYESYTSGGLQVPEGTITVRVPASDLEKALEEIKADAIETQNETISGQDVTDQYVDLESRLRAREAAEKQLLEMMDQAQNAEETLAIFNQLTQIQSEIEVLKGQMKYFEQAAALSSISVRLVAEETIQPIEVAGWKPQGVARDAVQALVNFFQGFVNFIIWLGIFGIPVMAVIILMLALLWRLLRWFWRKVFPKKTPPATPTA